MIDLGVIITGGVGVVSSIVSAWVSWFFARKKYNAEVDSTLLDNLEHSLEFYKALSDDNKNRLDDMLNRNEELEKEVGELRKQVNRMFALICTDLTCRHRLSKDLED